MKKNIDNKKRYFLKNLLFLSPAAYLAACDSANEKSKISSDKFPKIKLKMVTSFPKNLPDTDLPAQRLAKKIEQMSLGKIKITHYAAGELVPAFQVFDAVREQVADCAYTAPIYWVSKDKAISFFGCIPGGMTAKEIFLWLKHGKGQKLWDNLYSKYNLKGFPAGNTGTTMGGWYNKEINNLNDFQGLKMRIPGLGGEIINRLGGISVNMSGGEVINSLKLGAIDAAEWAGPWPDTIMGFHKVAKYYYGPGMHEPHTLCEFMINKKIWESLPEEYKIIIENASYASYLEVLTEYFYKNAQALRLIKKEKNVNVRSFSSEIVEMFFKHSEDIVEENSKDSEEYKNIYKSWQENIEVFNEYHQYSDNAYMKLRLKYQSNS